MKNNPANPAGNEQGSAQQNNPPRHNFFKSRQFLFASLVTSIFLVALSNVINSNVAKTNSNIFLIVLPITLSILVIRLMVKFPSSRVQLLGFALFSTFSAVAEILFIVYESVLQASQFPSIADGFWLAGYLALFAFFVFYLRPLRKMISKKVVMLSIIVSTGLVIPSVIQAYSLNSDSDHLALAVALAYPIIDALILGPVVVGIIVLYHRRTDPFLLAMLVAILSFIASDSVYLVIYNSYETGNPVDIGWIFGYILFSYATLSYLPMSKNRNTTEIVDLKNYTTVNVLSSEAIIKFVVPLAVVSILLVGSIFLISYYTKESARDAKENFLPVFVFFSMFASLVIVIFLINRNLMKLVRMHTREVEVERDMLEQKNSDKTQLLARSKVLEEQLKHSLEELQRTERYKDEFVAMVTHELKTPLVPIKGYADILLSGHVGSLNERQREQLSIIQSSSDLLLRLIQDLLDAQKIEMGQLKLDKKANDLSEIIHSAIENIRPELDSKGVVVDSEIAGGISCMCDKARMEQVLNNLLVNSMDFVPRGSGKIIVRLLRKDGKVEITIKDNGIGIEKDNLPNLFVKFYQIDTSVTRERGGTGLGLSICKGIVENHGGRIWAESEGLGKGSEFHILLPTDPP